MYILGINGSPNGNGSTEFMINEVLSVCKSKGASTEIISAPAAIAAARQPFCVSCSNPCSRVCYKGTLLEEAFEKMKKADAIIIGSPVYFGLMSAQLKAFFDKGRAMRGEGCLKGKLCGFVACGASLFGGQESTIKSMQSSAMIYGMTVVGAGSAELGAGHFGAAAVRPAEDDENAVLRCRSLGSRIMEELNKG